MAQYRLKWGLADGTGEVTINGVTNPSNILYIDEGTTVNVSIVLDAGFVAVEWFLNNTSINTTLSFSFTMPSRDSLLKGVISGTYAPIDDYGVKYTYNKKTINGDDFKIEIEEFGYGGVPEERPLESARYIFGSRGVDIVAARIVPSRLQLKVVANSSTLNYDEFLTGDNRKFRCRLYLKGEANAFFTGFISPNQISYDDTDNDYSLSLTAVDGMANLGYQNGNVGRWFSRFPASAALSGALNQTFIVKRGLSIACSLWESRMDLSDSPFPQFWISEACLFQDGDALKYLGAGGYTNEYLTLDKIVERITTPFTGRVYLWRDRFYFSRLADYNGTTIKYFDFDTDGQPNGSTTLNNDFTFSCINGASGGNSKPNIVKKIAYNDFRATLKLGVLQPTTKTADIDYTFVDIEDWGLTPPTATPPNVYRLTRWDYKQATWSDQPSSVPTGEIALVQYANGRNFDGCKIWTTTATTGVNDPNISYIELGSKDYGENISIVQEASNVFDVSIKYLLEPVSSSSPNRPTDHAFGMQIQVGSNYLERTGAETFGWTSTPTIMEFQFQDERVFNELSIEKIVVPESGELFVRLYQAICNSGARHEYALVLQDFKMKIEQNEALVNEEVSVRGQTDVGWNLVYREIDTYQGDAITIESTSALRLNTPPDYPVSESWTRDGIESLELLQVIVQDVANVKGVQPQRQVYGITADEPDPRRTVLYDGSRYIVTHIDYNLFKDEWKVELTEKIE